MNVLEQYGYTRCGVTFSVSVMEESQYSPAYKKLLRYTEILNLTTDKRKAAGIKGYITKLRKKITTDESNDYFLKALESKMQADTLKLPIRLIGVEEGIYGCGV